MKTQFVAVLGSSTPFIRLLKFEDGVGSVESLPFAAPVALGSVTISPNGLRMVASITTANVNALRLWTRATIEEPFVETAIAGLAGAYQIQDVQFISNSELAFCTSQLVVLGVFDAITGDVTYTQLDTQPTVIDGVVARIDLAGYGFNVFRPFATASAAMRAFVRTEDGSFTRSSTSATGAIFNAMQFGTDRYAMLSNSATTCLFVRPYSRSGNTIGWVSPYGTEVESSDRVPFAGALSDRFAHIVADENQDLILIPRQTTPFLVAMQALDFRTPLYLSRSTTPIPDLPIKPNDMLRVGNLFLFALNSNTQGTGRVRGYRFNGIHKSFPEEASVAALFNNWNTTPFYLASSEEIIADLPYADLYPVGSSLVFNNTIDYDNIGIALLNENAYYDAAHTSSDQVIGLNEVYGGPWPQGGIVASSAQVSSAADGAAVKAVFPKTLVDVPVDLEFHAVLVYDKTAEVPLSFTKFDEVQHATELDTMVFGVPDNNLISILPK